MSALTYCILDIFYNLQILSYNNQCKLLWTLQHNILSKLYAIVLFS